MTRHFLGSWELPGGGVLEASAKVRGTLITDISLDWPDREITNEDRSHLKEIILFALSVMLEAITGEAPMLEATG